MDALPALIGATAFTVHIVAYIWYVREIFNERVRPNAATWGIWLVGGVIELLTFRAIAGTNWTEYAVPAACALAVAAVCAVTVYKQVQRSKTRHRGLVYHKPERSDYLIVFFDPLAALIWIIYDAATLANTIAVWTSLFTFIPLWKTTYKDPESEHAGPWIIWCLAYLLMATVVVLEQESFYAEQMIYPTSYFIFHLIQAVLCLRKPN